jgi:hypothetical protein
MPGPKYGEPLFAGTSYPRKWREFVGQEGAVEYVRLARHAAKLRYRIGAWSTLFTTGAHGIGKTSLAKLVAHEMGVGRVEVQGPATSGRRCGSSPACPTTTSCSGARIHPAVSKGRSKAEWLLPVPQDGVKGTARRLQVIPNIMVIGATTEIQRIGACLTSQPVRHPSHPFP